MSKVEFSSFKHVLQPVAEAHYWYYITELSFYWSLLFCVSVDVKRKDFIHHITTIFLIGFSYCANYVLVETLVMLVHDSSDFLLEPFFGYYFFNALLLVLQALHIFWAWLILRMVYKFVFMVEKEERSDEESEPEEAAEEEEETS
ncbi:unnamed protein product [Coregonus sp. 'balchen']|nr:unnamed protein product [Coregonus sp. 'balchen']